MLFAMIVAMIIVMTIIMFIIVILGVIVLFPVPFAAAIFLAVAVEVRVFRAVLPFGAVFAPVFFAMVGFGFSVPLHLALRLGVLLLINRFFPFERLLLLFLLREHVFFFHLDSLLAGFVVPEFGVRHPQLRPLPLVIVRSDHVEHGQLGVFYAGLDLLPVAGSEDRDPHEFEVVDLHDAVRKVFVV